VARASMFTNEKRMHGNSRSTSGTPTFCVLVFAILFTIPARGEASPDSAIFNAVLGAERRGSWLVIPFMTRFDIRNLGHGQRHLGSELVDALLDRNDRPSWLAEYRPPEPHKLGALSLPSPDLKPPTFTRRGWIFQWSEEAKRANLSGVLYLSWPGYSRSGDEAVVYVATSCGFGLCGEGKAYVLRRVRSQWSVVRTVPLSVS
jgi:hypothetical protein